MTAKLYYVVEVKYSSAPAGDKLQIAPGSEIYTNKKNADEFCKDANKKKIAYRSNFSDMPVQMNFFYVNWQWDTPHGRLEIEFMKEPKKYTTETRRWMHQEIDRKARQSTAF